MHRGCASALTRLFRDQPQLATCRTIFQAASEGDGLAVAIVSNAIRKLGAAIAGLLHVFDPEIVIIGGQVADAGAGLLVPLQEEAGEAFRQTAIATSLSRKPLCERKAAVFIRFREADWQGASS